MVVRRACVFDYLLCNASNETRGEKIDAQQVRRARATREDIDSQRNPEDASCRTSGADHSR